MMQKARFGHDQASLDAAGAPCGVARQVLGPRPAGVAGAECSVACPVDEADLPLRVMRVVGDASE